MGNELKSQIRKILESYGLNDGEALPEAVERMGQAYKEESHNDTLFWYTRLTNDLINDDELKRTEHVGRILEYAREAAGLTKEDVEIKLPDKYIPHDSDFVAERISTRWRLREGRRGSVMTKWNNDPSIGTLIDDYLEGIPKDQIKDQIIESIYLYHDKQDKPHLVITLSKSGYDYTDVFSEAHDLKAEIETANSDLAALKRQVKKLNQDKEELEAALKKIADIRGTA